MGVKEKVTFITYQPYLSLGYATILGDPRYINRLNGMGVQFDADGRYTTDNPIAIQRLRDYAERTKSQYMIAELVDGVDQEKFSKAHYVTEAYLVDEASKNYHKVREEKEKEEEKQSEKREMYKLLRN